MSNILGKIANATGIDSLVDKLGFGGGNSLKMAGSENVMADVMDKSKLMKKGGKVSSASSRADGIAQRGKTRGRMV
jgi:hypothetical protein